jgi:hypothetical protein
MKFCSVCGVALAQPTPPIGQPEQNSSGIAYNPPQLPEKTKKKSNKLAISLILLALFVAWASNDEGSSNSETSSSANDTSSSATPSKPIPMPETLEQSVFEAYLPLTAEFSVKFEEIADNALSGDVQSTVASCYELRELSEQGLALSQTGNLDFDQAWGNAMDAGRNSANSCIIEDFDSASTYLAEMTEYINSATSYIE